MQATDTLEEEGEQRSEARLSTIVPLALSLSLATKFSDLLDRREGADCLTREVFSIFAMLQRD